jgi:hypothetical protein
MDYKRIVCWLESDPYGKDVIREATVEECIKRQLVFSYETENHEDALRKFMDIHWAWFREECADD